MKATAISHRGKRDINQDLIFEYTASDDSYLFAIIDGMGGYENGEIAAKMIGENIQAYLSTVKSIDAFHIQKAINKSNLAIRQQKKGETDNMGATIGGVIIKETTVIYFWIGDVKILHFRNNKLLFESIPHNLVSELVENGTILEPLQLSKYKHIVTRSIHGDLKKSQAEMAYSTFDKDSDLLMICSDGVHDIFDALQIEKLQNQFKSPKIFQSQLESKLKIKAKDNYSFGVIVG